MTSATFETLADQAELLRGSKLMDRGWYARRYPDATALGMDPVEHYLRYGAALGRNPGPRFDTGFYRATYPDVAASGLNPLAHYLRHGARKGRLTRPDGSERVAARRALDPIRRKLLGFGFVARGLDELAALAETGATPEVRAHAARELALWRLRSGGPEAAALARTHLPRAADCGETAEYFTRLAALELLCAHAAGAPEAEADAVLARAEAAGWTLDEILLARAAFAPDAAARIPWINRALARRGIAPVALAGTGPTPYDRLSCPTAAQPLTGGPLVSVLVAAYNSAATLPTALAALQAQRWTNLEILVIDDASPDADTAAVASAFAAADPRIRLIRMATNGGAYVARNRGLAEAQGEFVTLHDADDWSHPDKIATQAEFLIRHPEVVGCTSERARATPDLVFRRMTGNLKLINMNTSSFMFRRAYVRAAFGGWDTARFGADTELITRISHADGATAVRRMETGALSFQRVSDTSIVADAHFGISGTPFGARLVYHDLYVRRHREDGLRTHPDPARRSFPAPRVMRADRPAATGPRRCDLVFAGDLADPRDAAAGGGSAAALAAEIAEAANLGLEIAAFPAFDYDDPPRGLLIAAGIRDQLQAGRAELATYGEALDCELLVLRDLRCFQDEQRFLPEVRAAAAVFVLRADELGGAPSAAARRLGVAAAAVAARFGAAPEWRPADAAARAALAALPAPEGSGGEWDASRAFAALVPVRMHSRQL